MGLNTDNNSDCSRVPTVNLFRVVTRSPTSALNTAFGDTQARMRGFHAQTDIAARPSACLIRLSVLTRPTKSFTTACSGRFVAQSRLLGYDSYDAHAATTVNIIPDMAGQ